MRDCKVILRGNTAEVSQVSEYINEHGATRLIITLSDELKAADISYHTICFKPGAALKNPPNIKVTTDMLTAENGTLTYPLPQALTGFGALDAQVQAHATDKNGELVALVKSPVFRLNFEPSITGDEEVIIGDADGFIAEIHKALKELNLTVDAADELCDRISEAFESGELNGEKGDTGEKGEKGDKGDTGDKGDKGDKGEDGKDGKNALINGFNAVTLKGGENLRLTQQEDIITLSVDSVPVYHILPETAECGEICLYAPPNTISAAESGKNIAFNWEGFCRAQNDTTTFDITFHKDGTELGFINAGYTFSDDMTYIENTLGIVFENEEWQICFINGTFESQYSYCKKDGATQTLTEPPAYYTLPEFDSAVCTFENVTDCVFYASFTPMVYLGEWQNLEKLSGNGLTPEQEADLAANTAARHEHENIDTLDCFETFAQDDDFDDTPMFNGIPLWTAEHGGVISDIVKNDKTEELTIKFRKYPTLSMPEEQFVIPLGNGSVSSNAGAKSGSFIHISFDDVTLCMQNLINKTYTSVFEEPFFAWLKSLNEQYGAKFSLYVMNIANLANVPDTYKSEFLAAKDWLKFGLHSNTANSTYAGATYATGAADWNAFVAQIIRITGTFETIDRVPRLHYFYGSKEALQGMRDCDCGALGFLAADDSRQSYYLDNTQNTFLKTHDSIIDFENGLLFYNTDFRGDWFKEGFTSENTYNAPIKTNVYDELLYRFALAKYADTFKSYIYFCHEWQLYNGTAVSENKVWTEDICRFGITYNIPFDYPQNRIDINPTSFKFLSVNSNGGTNDSSEYLFSDFENLVLDNNDTRLRANQINENFTFKANDIISIGDYNTYSFAVGSGDKTDDTNGLDSWFNGGYVTADFVLTEEQAASVTQIIIKRNDETAMTETDLNYINANLKVIRH